MKAEERVGCLRDGTTQGTQLEKGEGDLHKVTKIQAKRGLNNGRAQEPERAERSLQDAASACRLVCLLLLAMLPRDDVLGFEQNSSEENVCWQPRISPS